MLDYRSHTVIEVYRCGSYTRAAECLRLTQPAVSQHVQAVEHAYGAKLFERAGRGVRPTPAGEAVYKLLAAQENDERRLAEALAHDTQEPPLRFGATRTIADYVMPQVLVRAHAAGARTGEMAVGNTRELLARIEHGELDGALVEGPYDRARFEGEPIMREPFCAIAAPALAATLPSPITLDALLPHPLITREEGSGSREILERRLKLGDRAPADFADIITVGSIPTIKVLVKAGAGIAFLYRVAAAQELARGTLKDVTPPTLALEHDFTLVWQRGSKRAPALARTVASWFELGIMTGE